jgi:cytidylate kinase
MTTKRRRPRRIVVAIDGPAGAGKSTVARRLAAALGYQVLDTGALYRSVALVARERGVAWDDEAGLACIAESLAIRFVDDGDPPRVVVAGRDVSVVIRTPAIAEGASRVSALPAVRAGLLGLQRRLGAQGGVIAEGRDIGTVVFPRAEAKFFLTASEDERARRRHEDLRAAGHATEAAATLAELRARDTRDAGRAVAPLAKAEDAIAIDSSALSIDQVVDRLLAVVRARETTGSL